MLSLKKQVKESREVNFTLNEALNIMKQNTERKTALLKEENRRISESLALSRGQK